MKDLREFNIQFVGLKEGNHLYTYDIDNTFFSYFDYDEFKSSSIQVSLDFVKKSTLLELTFNAKGYVEVPCDTTGELYNQEIDAVLPLIVNFGIEFNDDNEEILILPHEAYEFNVAQYIYEMIVLAVPLKRIHPGVLDGSLESATLSKLKELDSNRVEKTVEETETDPRWDKLKNLITEKKT
ncbi:YceD family protein [Polaribacter sargassicola]|uniref:YceD family protein n=1 Tax=Polaribacter sargassicola TaxID=2836891 RepID=UPI001F16008F|nr:DUF177 domain-containing protein [Polaribacter sp. DS7-9]MCG1037393.1 DUF177 domain-containing protein [Polaribacter sp. DS7-9]